MNYMERQLAHGIYLYKLILWERSMLVGREEGAEQTCSRSATEPGPASVIQVEDLCKEEQRNYFLESRL